MLLLGPLCYLFCWWAYVTFIRFPADVVNRDFEKVFAGVALICGPFFLRLSTVRYQMEKEARLRWLFAYRLPVVAEQLRTAITADATDSNSTLAKLAKLGAVDDAERLSRLSESQLAGVANTYERFRRPNRSLSKTVEHALELAGFILGAILGTAMQSRFGNDLECTPGQVNLPGLVELLKIPALWFAVAFMVITSVYSRWRRRRREKTYLKAFDKNPEKALNLLCSRWWDSYDKVFAYELRRAVSLAEVEASKSEALLDLADVAAPSRWEFSAPTMTEFALWQLPLGALLGLILPGILGWCS